MKNKWKLAFFTLLAVIILFFFFLLIMVKSPVKGGGGDQIIIDQKTEMMKTSEVALQVAANKIDLNKIINHYLEEEGFTGPIDYQVILTDVVELYGTFPVFDDDLEMLLTFEPKALDNGGLVLKQESISIGTLNLPVAYVMKMIQNNYNLPEWVQINPNEESIYVSLQELELKSDIRIRANSFDLKNDHISFTLLVPVE